MKKKFKAVVIKNPQMYENCCAFVVKKRGGACLVISTDYQACKDHIFVKEGQEMEISGQVVDLTGIQEIIITEEARINLLKEKEQIKKKQNKEEAE